MAADRHVIVIGAGVAGVAAAFAAQRANARVTIVSSRPGASCLMSGAIDDEPWETARYQPTGSALQDVQSFIEALGLWQATPQPALLASMSGVLRCARGRDRALLDLCALRGARIAVPAVQRAGWDARLLAGMWSADRHALEQQLAFEPVEAVLFAPDLRAVSDPDLARQLDDPAALQRVAEALRGAVDGFDAVLTGPWLGVATDAVDRLSAAVGKRVGETVSSLPSTAGSRFELASGQLLARIGVAAIDACAGDVTLGPGGFVVDAEGCEPMRADGVVLAGGGLIGGGVIMTTSESESARELPECASHAFSLSVRIAAGISARAVRLEPVGSLQGPNLEDFSWPEIPEQRALIETVGVARRGVEVCDSANAVVKRLFVAGAMACDAPHTVLAAARMGLRAGAAAAEFASS